MMLSQRLTRSGVSFRFLAFAVCLGIVLSLSATSAWAQSSTAGTVAGQVIDEQNAAIPGATVKITDTSTNAALTVNTNNDGLYVFPQVSPGKYNVSFIKQGFGTYEVNGQAVDVSTAQQGDQVSIKVAVPFNKVNWTPLFFFTNASLESETLVMMRQG